MKRLAILFLIALAGCTRAQMSQIGALGSPGHITCYSGGKVIYEGDSTGKIATEDRSDGWFFEDAATRRLVRVSGACVINN
jgi:hypothetical protein